jgi:hypothetical protein
MKAATIEIKNHPRSSDHQIAIVRTGGRVYGVTYAEPSPTEAEVEQLWREERKACRPFVAVDWRGKA